VASRFGSKNLLYIFLISFLATAIDQGVAFSQLTNPDLPERDGVKLFERAKLHAALSTEEQLETNIFLANTDRKFDGITVLNPSVGIDVPFWDNSLSIDYNTGVYMYNTYHSQNHVDHRVRGLAEINLSDYKITLNDVFRKFTDRAADESSNRVTRSINKGRVGVEAQFERLGFDAGYTNKLEIYDTNDPVFGPLTYEDRNHDDNIFDFSIIYRFLPKTSFIIENDLGFIHYYNSSQVPGSWFDETLFGIKGEWFARMTLNFKAGFRYQSYDSSDIISDKDYIGPVFRGGFDYNISERDILAFEAEKSVYESIYANMNYYDLNQVGFKYTHKFNDKVSANVLGSYQINLYPSETIENGITAKRYDNYFEGGAGIRYDIRKWVSVEAKYEYKQRLSRFDVFDYVDNVVTLRGTVGF